jgi:hypothetical protein
MSIPSHLRTLINVDKTRSATGFTASGASGLATSVEYCLPFHSNTFLPSALALAKADWKLTGLSASYEFALNDPIGRVSWFAYANPTPARKSISMTIQSGGAFMSIVITPCSGPGAAIIQVLSNSCL